MKKEVKTITEISLENNERECISDVASINCTDIDCNDCPLLYDDIARVCIRTIARKICNDNHIGFKWC